MPWLMLYRLWKPCLAVISWGQAFPWTVLTSLLRPMWLGNRYEITIQTIIFRRYTGWVVKLLLSPDLALVEINPVEAVKPFRFAPSYHLGQTPLVIRKA